MDVSVIIPTHNRASMVSAAIASVLAQTCPACEVIVVDDGSTDDTQDVVRRFGDRIRYLRQENRGVSAARNAAMDLARGEFIAFLDSDDLWYPFKLELQLAVLEQLPAAGFVFTEFDILKDDGTRRPRGSRTWLAEGRTLESCFPNRAAWESLRGELPPGVAPFDVLSGRIYRAMLDEALVLTSTSVVRRSALAPGNRFPEGVSIFEDWEFHARVARRHDAAFLDLSTVANRGHHSPGRLTGCTTLAKAEAYLAMVRRVWKADLSSEAPPPEEVRRAEGRALLAVSKEAVLASRPGLARSSLSMWRALESQPRTAWATVYAACTVLPAGRILLRQMLRARTLWRLLTTGAPPRYSVNPAA